MIEVISLEQAADATERLAPLYAVFQEEAGPRYAWDDDPLDFDSLKTALRNKLLRGYVVLEDGDPLGFMLYRFEDHRAVEVNILHLPAGRDWKVPLDRMVRRFLDDIAPHPGWDVVSYAMLGDQARFIRTLPWYGFKPVGQAVVKFQFSDQVPVQILFQQEPPPLPEGYRLDRWQPEYAGGTAESIYQAFSKATDALWDPRFRTLTGARQVVAMLTAGGMGDHIPQCTSVLLRGDEPVGFCFLVQASMIRGNIPLIGVRPEEKGRKLGYPLLHRTLTTAVQEMIEARIGMVEITATLDTDNFRAIRMYRRFGFQESIHYPHVYLNRKTLAGAATGKNF